METRSNFGSQKFGTTKIRNDNEDSYASINLPLTLSPPSARVSVSKTGVNIDSIKTGWRNACAAAGLVDLRFHDTRHTFAIRLRANGVHEWDIRDLLGHTTTRMTSVYTHQTPANLRQAVTTLGQSKPGRVVRFPRKNRDSQRQRKAG